MAKNTVKCEKKLVLENSNGSQINNYIIVHNSSGMTLKELYNHFLKHVKDESKYITHYCLDDETVYQTLKDNWQGNHTVGSGHYKEWDEVVPDGTVTDSNSIGITVVDNSSVDLEKTTEILIELIRHLIHAYNIPIENIVRHGDTTPTKCPKTIVENKKWEYILEEVRKRESNIDDISIDFSAFEIATEMNISNNTSSTTIGQSLIGSQTIQIVYGNDGKTTVQESLSNANTSDNWVDMHKIKGITLHHYPPYHICEVDNMKNMFKRYNWDRAFHYKVDRKTTIDFAKKPTSGITRGGNIIGTSTIDTILTPGEGVYSGVIIGGSGNAGTVGIGDQVTPSGDVYGWPLLDIKEISSKFGPRNCPYHGQENHGGIDIPANEGTEIHAYASGKVVRSDKNNDYGNVIKIDHGSGCFTLYAHLHERKVELNSIVTSGQVIGTVGSTGNSTGNHLHFELHIDNERVDPLIYVKPGGGSKKLPPCFENLTEESNTEEETVETSSIVFKTMDMEDNIITSDTIDKGKICFASENNGQHTYIERALFNNQHPKYTLSVGAFFDDQDTQADKDKNYDYPATEKKLIEQCAKALYDEGFTSDNLWREFDLNRAPSPILYLDRTKWIKFLEEVQKQVDWLNTKYGKVTSRYIPNNLLKNENTNEFIEMSPDLGVDPSSGGSVTIGTTTGSLGSIQGGIWVGDSRTYILNGMEGRGKNYIDPTCDVYSKSGVTAAYFYTKDGTVNRTKTWNKNAKYIFVWLGTNAPMSVKLQTNFLTYLKDNFTCPIFVAKELVPASHWKEGKYTASDWKKYIGALNDKVSALCKANGMNFIDISDGLMQEDGYGVKDMFQPDGIHYSPKGCEKVYENICKAIAGNLPSDTGESTEETATTSNYKINYDYAALVSNNYEDILFTIKDIKDTQADKNNIGKYAYVNSDTTVYLYESPDTATKKITGLVLGDEVHITATNSIFYKVEFSTYTGYIRAKVISIIPGNKYGITDKSNIGKDAWIKFANTEVYDKSFKLIETENTSIQDKCLILDIKDDYYYVRLKNDNEGYIKAYRLTFDYNDFDYIEGSDDIEQPYQYNQIAVPNGDFEGETANNDTSNSSSSDNDGHSIDNDSSSTTVEYTEWEEYGTLDFNIVDNPAFDEDGHWNYRGTKFGRLKNTSNKMAGITNNVTIPDNNDGNYDIRISAWFKQVTQDDLADASSDIKSISASKIIMALLDKNNDIKHSIELTIPSDYKKFERRAYVFTNVKKGGYKIFIGSKSNIDIFVDDVQLEQLWDYTDIGDSDTSTNIGLSGVGSTSIDNGGIMAYSIGKPSNSYAKQPKINTIITNEEYEEIMSHTNSKEIDTYIMQFEPYDKGLESILDAPVTPDDRLNTLTETINTFTGNDIYYNVVETGPGSIDHCVKPADELNILYKQIEAKAEPIYPDLVIPPNYSTSDYDTKSINTIPLQALQEGTLEDKDIVDKKIQYDYNTLEDKKKESKGYPINYNDPYPYDNKITELESHNPKVMIDEIESRLYSCNHPGCPIAHPMAKNFAMLSDMQLAQSKKIEQRLIRIENILSTMIRNIGRLGSRVNINCVYYGGQDIFGKYKTIRCTHDDRIHDGASMTLDQCLCCTRYEPIIGQIYDILDESGMNGSALLDDMQMAYMTLDDLKNLNQVERRSSSFLYSKVDEDNKEKSNEPKDIKTIWKDKDKKTYETNNPDNKDNIQESDYTFIMNWNETSINGQESDVKVYPTEGITAKYHNTDTDAGDNGILLSTELDKTLNSDIVEDIEKYNSIIKGVWTDTREVADTIQDNKYTSEDFYFENFNKNRTGYEYDNGIQGYVGLSSTGSIRSGLGGAECRNKIVEKAREIVELHKDGKATYSNTYRTIDDSNRNVIKAGDATSYKGSEGMIGYDCSGLASCCYKYAGLNSLYGKSCSGGSIMDEIVNNGGEMWLANQEGIAKALPGDCLLVCKSGGKKVSPTEEDMKSRRKLSVYHIMVYLGNNEVAHASEPAPVPKSIRIDTFDESHYNYKYSFFIRPKDLIEADMASGGTTTSGIKMVNGTIDGYNYVCELERCVCTNYGPWEKGHSHDTTAGVKTDDWLNKAAAAHNMPMYTKIYMPELKGKLNDTGIFTVIDTGGYGFDFDILTREKTTYLNPYGPTFKGYVLEWGNSKIVAQSFTYMHNRATGKFSKLWTNYKNKNGCTINLLKFRKDDADAKNQPWY